MRLAFAAVALLALPAFLSGCLTDDGGAEPGADAALVADAAGRRDQQLGAQSGLSAMPARFAFDVTVPEGGATLVRWELLMENGPAGPAAGNRVEGPGCGTGGVGNVNVVVQVGLSNTVRGSCDDLPAGTHSFEVVLTAPAPSFQATVVGSVLGPPLETET